MTLNKKVRLTTIFFLSTLLCNLYAQEAQTVDTLQLQAVDTTHSNVESLLPKHMLPTQRLLWGEQGVLRQLEPFTLTEANRDRELEIRSYMFTAHRYLGFATLAGMVAQGIVGQRLYNGDASMKGLHEELAGAVNFGYFTTASLAFLSPPGRRDRAKGLTALNVHKCLSIVHLSSMIATNILSGMVEHNPGLKTLHRATAYTAFGSFLASTIVINF
jgi:hypothetical protein